MMSPGERRQRDVHRFARQQNRIEFAYMDYRSKLDRLEHLHDLVERYIPLMYQSSDEGKRLHREICDVYGEVADVFEEMVGRRRIDVPNSGGPGSSTYPNFFE